MTSSEISVLKNRLLQVTQPDERLFLLKTLATAAHMRSTILKLKKWHANGLR